MGIKTRLALLLALAMLGGCDEADGGLHPTSFRILDPGSGPALDGRVSPIPGSRLGTLLVQDRVLEGREVVQVGSQSPWLQVNSSGLVAVGDARNGLYPAPRVLLPAELRDGMSWLTDPFGRDPDRRYTAGANPSGDTPAHDAEEVSFGYSGGGVSALELLSGRASELPPPYTVAYAASDGVASVLLDTAWEAPSPGPTVRLTPVEGGSLFAKSHRPVGIDVLSSNDGVLVLFRGEGSSRKTMVSEGGTVSAYFALPTQSCMQYSGAALEESAEPCVPPEEFLVRADGSLAAMPYERLEQRDGFGNIISVAFVTSGVMVETPKGIQHFSNKVYEDWTKPSPTVALGQVVSLPGGEGIGGGVWRVQKQPDGSLVFGFSGHNLSRLATWDGASTMLPILAPLPSPLSLHNSAAGQELYRVSNDGRVEEVLLRPDGLRYLPIARLALPSGHLAKAAVRLEGRRFLVFTHTGELGYDTQYYTERNYLADTWDWALDPDVLPNFGEAHLWYAELPEPTAEPQLPAVSEALSMRSLGRNLELCWPAGYGPGTTEGWTLEGESPAAVWASEDGCLLLQREPSRLVNASAQAEGALPNLGNARLETNAATTLDTWYGTVLTQAFKPENVREESAPFLGCNARSDANGFGLWVFNEELCEEGNLDCSSVATLGGEGALYGSFELGTVTPEHPSRLESAGVQAGGLLLQDRVLRRGRVTLLEPPQLPSPTTPWRHEGLLIDGTVCGHLGRDTLYCLPPEGGPQRTVSGLARLSERQWWGVALGPDPESIACDMDPRIARQYCLNGRFWLLDATPEQPSFTLFDPEAMSTRDFALADVLPEFPTELAELRVESTHVPALDPKQDFQRPVTLVAARAQGQSSGRYWLVWLGPEGLVSEPPLRPAFADFGRWGPLVEAQALPLLRPIPVLLNSALVIQLVSPVLGTVASFPTP